MTCFPDRLRRMTVDDSPGWTVRDLRFLTAVREEFGEARFTSGELPRRLPVDKLPGHVEAGMRNVERRDPARMMGRWLAQRVGWTYRGLTLQKLSRGDSAQYWKFGILPTDAPPAGVMVMMGDYQSGRVRESRWHWESIGLWPDEVVK